MSGPVFRTLDEVRYGAVEQLSPGVRRVTAENPSKFTYLGTGTFIVGHGDVAVIDPGPDLDSHRAALSASLAGDRVRAILVTHCHADHSPLSAWLRAETGAPTFAQGPHATSLEEDLADLDDLDDDVDARGDVDDATLDDAARDDTTHRGASGASVRVEESVDREFAPDEVVAHDEVIDVAPGVTMRAVLTPGHTSNHACFAFDQEATLFSGDHVMGWSTTVVSPPDGDMRDYLDSLRLVRARGDALLRPTHGPERDDVDEYVGALIDHRLAREQQVLDAVRRGVDTIPVMVAELYADVREELHRPARRSVLAHLRKLVEDGMVVTVDGERASVRSRFGAV